MSFLAEQVESARKQIDAENAALLSEARRCDAREEALRLALQDAQTDMRREVIEHEKTRAALIEMTKRWLLAEERIGR